MCSFAEGGGVGGVVFFLERHVVPNVPYVGWVKPYLKYPHSSFNPPPLPQTDRGSLGARSTPAALLGAALAGAMGFLIARGFFDAPPYFQLKTSDFKVKVFKCG